jgi:hypothetical protein
VVAFASTSLLGYVTVFVIQAGLLVLSIVMLARIDVASFRRESQQGLADRAAMMNEIS